LEQDTKYWVEMKITELNLTDSKDVGEILMMIREVIEEFSEFPERYEEIVILLASAKQAEDGTLDKTLESIFGRRILTTNKSLPGHGLGVGTKGCLQAILEPFENMSERMQRFMIRHECGHLLFPHKTSISLSILQAKYSGNLAVLESFQNDYPVHLCIIERYTEGWLEKPLGISKNMVSPRIAFRQETRKGGVKQAIFYAIINSVNVLRIIYIYDFLLSKHPELKEKFTSDIQRYHRYLNSWWYCLAKGTNCKLPEPTKILKPHHFESKESFFSQILWLLTKTKV